MYPLSALALAILTLAGQSAADDSGTTNCTSYGYDFVNDGGPYCINTTSTAYFAFTTEFFGCQASDVQDWVTPILVDPNGDEYLCSDIEVTPDGKNQISMCNVAGNEVTKNNMISGPWLAVIEGLTFAYQRGFSISAAPPVTMTSTPTATFNVTSTPLTTIITTLTKVYSTTLTPSTITVPTTTITSIITTTPAQVTSTWTSTSTRTRTTRVYSKTVTTTTITTSCRTQRPSQDPTCTVRPTKATLAAAASSITMLPRQWSQMQNSGQNGWGVPAGLGGSAGSGGRGGRNGWSGHRRALARRDPDPGATDTGPDMCTTTVIDTVHAVSSYVTIWAPTSTETDTINGSVTSTITPAPVTAYTGKARTTVTITAPTPTRTRTARTYVASWTTSTVWATITSTVQVAPSGWVCATAVAH